MPTLSVPLSRARPVWVAALDAFEDACVAADEWTLLGASRCHGWSRLDVVSHMTAGLQEMLGGFVSPAETEPTVDAASYWPAFAEQEADPDPVLPLMAQRRRTAVYSRPDVAVEHLVDVTAAVRRGTSALGDGRLTWQGQVFDPGDFLAIWVVETVIHHLDLDLPSAPPADGLAVARATVEAIAEAELPRDWDDTQAVLVGAGRRPVPEELGAIAGRLPVLA